jgi:uncharacterized membrane protein (DUF485 family)
VPALRAGSRQFKSGHPDHFSNSFSFYRFTLNWTAHPADGWAVLLYANTKVPLGGLRMARTDSEHKIHQVLEDADFKKLSSKKDSISLTLTLLTMAIYFGFIFLLAFNPDLLGRKLGSGVTLGIPLGIGVIVLAWVFTGIYVRWANSEYDDMVRRIKAHIEE